MCSVFTDKIEINKIKEKIIIRNILNKKIKKTKGKSNITIGHDGTHKKQISIQD